MSGRFAVPHGLRSAMERHLRHAWTQRGFLHRVMWPLSWLYGLAWQLVRSRQVPAAPLPVPLVVVGNVVAGGTGKTPIVMALASHWAALGLRVGVVSRGHGRTSRETMAVEPHSEPHAVGDEPLLIRRRCGVPVWVGAQRRQVALALLAQHPDVQVLIGDDGLQHAAWRPDLSLLVFDGRGLGNGCLLPAGPLREPWPKSADWLLHRGQPVPGFVGPQAAVQRSLGAKLRNGRGETLGLAGGPGQPFGLLAAIAQPEPLLEQLAGLGWTPSLTVLRADHADWSDWTPPIDGPPLWVCTEKDAVKLWPLHPEVWAVQLELELPDRVWTALDTWIAAQGIPVDLG